LRYSVHLPSIVAPPLIVKLDDRELVGSAGHEAVKRLMLRVRHDPGRLPGLDRCEALQTVIRHGVSPHRFINQIARIRRRKKQRSMARRQRRAK
jgi:hypothetical protein